MPLLRARFQHHHLLPRSLAQRRQIAEFLAPLQACGFSIANRNRNCLWLPADEDLAWHLGCAMHRGPHPDYTDLVTHRVERIRQWSERHGANRWTAERTAERAVLRLTRLQRALSHSLQGGWPRLVQLNRRDPMRIFNDYSYLDDAIDRLDALSRAEASIAPPSSGVLIDDPAMMATRLLGN